MNKFLVLKWEDIKAARVGFEMGDLITTIHKHKQATGTLVNHEYLVVNKAEPYADKVKALIEEYDRQKVEDIRQRAIDQCDGVIDCSAATCLAEKEIQIITNFEGDFPSSSDIDRHLRAIYDITHEYNQTLHRATHPPQSNLIKTRLMVGQASLMLNQAQVNAVLNGVHSEHRHVESLLTPESPKRSHKDV